MNPSKPGTILVTGQCSLHMGRMEYGNLGNFFIADPLFREIARCFPQNPIETTFAMSPQFCAARGVTSLGYEPYDTMRPFSLLKALGEYAVSLVYRFTGLTLWTTDYIAAVRRAGLVLDMSGDIWGDNSDLVSPNRFYIGLLKDLIAVNFGRPVCLICSSLGPFRGKIRRRIARHALRRFRVVTLREPECMNYLKSIGLDLPNMDVCACPAWLFEARPDPKDEALFREKYLAPVPGPKAGVILCGWNMVKGPFDRADWNDDDMRPFADALAAFLDESDAHLFLMSHNHAFTYQDGVFHHRAGRDLVIARALYDVLTERGYAGRLTLVTEPFDSHATKAFVGHLDMLVSGRIHGAVGGMSQHVPTVMVDYGHEPRAHKVRGFAAVAGMEDMVADPADENDLRRRILACWADRAAIRARLEQSVPRAREQARRNFVLCRQAVAKQDGAPA